ncbi:ABC-2 type transport system permease protein [Brevibacterium aurantiacum]|nr:ABC-2 type transport system permease protein [Brevibacterium aurantiacum]
MMRLDEAVLDTSVFVHIGQYPAQDLSAEAVLTLTAATAVLLALGVVGFRRRNLITA